MCIPRIRKLLSPFINSHVFGMKGKQMRNVISVDVLEVAKSITGISELTIRTKEAHRGGNLYFCDGPKKMGLVLVIHVDDCGGYTAMDDAGSRKTGHLADFEIAVNRTPLADLNVH